MLYDLYERLENAEQNGFPVWNDDPDKIAEELLEQTGEKYSKLEVSFVQSLHRIMKNEST